MRYRMRLSHTKSDAMAMILFMRLQCNFSVARESLIKQHACVSLRLATQCSGNEAGRLINYFVSAVYAQEKKGGPKTETPLVGP